jgi:hypothetical protein
LLQFSGICYRSGLFSCDSIAAILVTRISTILMAFSDFTGFEIHQFPSSIEFRSHTTPIHGNLLSVGGLSRVLPLFVQKTRIKQGKCRQAEYGVNQGGEKENGRRGGMDRHSIQ